MTISRMHVATAVSVLAVVALAGCGRAATADAPTEATSSAPHDVTAPPPPDSTATEDAVDAAGTDAAALNAILDALAVAEQAAVDSARDGSEGDAAAAAAFEP